MQETIRQKFIQNEHLLKKLISDTHDKYYKMTTDHLWATGQRLTTDGKELDQSTFTGKNRTGEILSNLKWEFIGSGPVGPETPTTYKPKN